jgi:hypothetical protein
MAVLAVAMGWLADHLRLQEEIRRRQAMTNIVQSRLDLERELRIKAERISEKRNWSRN